MKKDQTNKCWLPPPLDKKCLILPYGSFKLFSTYPLPPLISQSLILAHVTYFESTPYELYLFTVALLGNLSHDQDNKVLWIIYVYKRK